MSIRPSKKKISSPLINSSCLQTVNSLSHTDNHPYLMLIEDLRNLKSIKTPTKKFHKNKTKV
jgi:hypothetical protein